MTIARPPERLHRIPVLFRLLATCASALLVGCIDGVDPNGRGAGVDLDHAADAVLRNTRGACLTEFEHGVDYFPEKVEAVHAEGFQVSYSNYYKTVEVTVPDTETTIRLVLVQCGAPEPPVEDALVVRVPALTAASLTTTTLPHFESLRIMESLVGVGTAAYVSTDSIRRRIEAAGLPDLADSSGQPDYERLLHASPDVVFIDAHGATILDVADRVAAAGITPALAAGFAETAPLGRAEWLKYTALFFNAEGAAATTFDRIAASYGDTVRKVADTVNKPLVVANEPYEGTWFVPGGNSFFAKAVGDAGGRYVFEDEMSVGSVALDIETVLDRGADADIWMQAGSMHGSLGDLLAVDSRFGEFAAFLSGQVWAWDRFVTAEGGNALFELGHLRADLYLADFAKIFHPMLFEDYEFVFYGQVPR